MDLAVPTRRDSFRSGLLFGVGFSVPFMVVFWIGFAILAIVMREIQTPPGKVPQRTSFGPDAGLTILEQNAHGGSSSLYVVGQLANKGRESWESVRLQVRLLDSENHVVGLCEEMLLGILRPGSQVYFQVDCDNWDNDAFPKYEHYLVEVVDARLEFRNGA